jgi:hypothetical protein
MKQVKIKKIKPLTEPRFIKTREVTYKRKGHKKAKWEMVVANDSVHALVLNTDTNKLLLVNQTRIPVMVNQDTDGVTLECCAGIIDKYDYWDDDYKAQLTAIDEVQEELGYQSERDSDMIQIDKIIGSTGMTGSSQYLFYCEVDNSNYVGQQLEPEEDIKVVEIDATQECIKNLLQNTHNTDAVTKYLLSWFCMNKL